MKTRTERKSCSACRKSFRCEVDVSESLCATCRKPPAPPTGGRSSRSCFGIDYYLDEMDAEAASVVVVRRRERYNGGYFDGMPCGRDEGFDHVSKELGVKVFAVTRGVRGR